MTVNLNKAIEAYFNADRAGDPEAVAVAFVENGSVKDKGRTHTGREAIRKWMAEALTEYSYSVEPFSIGADHGRTLVTAHAVGTFPGGPIDLRFFFVLSDDKIAELEITV